MSESSLAADAAQLSSVLRQAQATEEQLRLLRRSAHTLQATLGSTETAAGPTGNGGVPKRVTPRRFTPHSGASAVRGVSSTLSAGTHRRAVVAVSPFDRGPRAVSPAAPVRGSATPAHANSGVRTTRSRAHASQPESPQPGQGGEPTRELGPSRSPPVRTSRSGDSDAPRGLEAGVVFSVRPRSTVVPTPTRDRGGERDPAAAGTGGHRSVRRLVRNLDAVVAANRRKRALRHQQA